MKKQEENITAESNKLKIYQLFWFFFYKSLLYTSIILPQLTNSCTKSLLLVFHLCLWKNTNESTLKKKIVSLSWYTLVK
jgi:hypothetical protein